MITEAQIADFAKACEEMRAKHYAINSASGKPNEPEYIAFHAHVGYSMGRKYARLMTPNGSNPDGSAYAFVDLSNGDILKPASWNAPAKHARGNIANGIAGMGPYGPAYLR